MDEIINIVLKQGFGYVLFIGSMFVNAYLFRLLTVNSEKRINDVKEITTIFTSTAKDLLNGNSNLQQSINTLTDIINSKKLK